MLEKRYLICATPVVFIITNAEEVSLLEVTGTIQEGQTLEEGIELLVFNNAGNTGTELEPDYSQSKFIIEVLTEKVSPILLQYMETYSDYTTELLSVSEVHTIQEQEGTWSFNNNPFLPPAPKE